MSGLILKLRPRERVLINGAVIENGERRSSFSVVTPDAKVLRLRDAIHPDEVNTPVRRVCYIAQLVLSGDAEADDARHQLLRGIEQLSQVFPDKDSQMRLSMATQNIIDARFYQALQELRGLLGREQRLLDAARS